MGFWPVTTVGPFSMGDPTKEVRVALLTEDTVRSLAAFRSGSAPVTSCYLDVDGRRLPSRGDLQRAFATLVRRAGLNGNSRAQAPPSVRRDLARMERFVKALARGSTRGVAMFSCSDDGFWAAHELPVRVTNQLVVEPVACVRQLESVLEEFDRIGVLLTDRQRARVFVFELGELTARDEVLDELARRSDDDRGELVKTRQSSQLSAQARQHVKRAAQLAFDVFQRAGFEHLIVGAPQEVAAELEHALHPYLRRRVADRVHLPVAAPDEQVRLAALAVEQRLERESEGALVARLRDAVGGGTRGVGGLGPTLAALCDGRVERLCVSEGYEAEGWQCPECGCMAQVGPSCPGCESSMERVPDVVELAVAHTLATHGRVLVCIGNADLDVLGRIGALLRY